MLPLFLLLAPLLSVAARVKPVKHANKHHKAHAPAPTAANSAVMSKAEQHIKKVFGELEHIQAEVKEEEDEEGMHIVKGKDKAKNLKRQQLRKRLLRELDGEVNTVLPAELKKLDGVFQSEERKNGWRPRHRMQHFSRGQRAAQKIANRQVFRYEDPEQCGTHIPATKLGIRSGPEAAKIFQQPALMQIAEPEEEDEEGYPLSWARPGVGVNQTLADNGRSTMGKVGAPGKVGQEAPFVTVYKDGFFMVGCFKDAMLHVGDMYSMSGKLKYKKQYQNISVVVYDAIVLEEKQQEMSPKVCFEFCRTIEGMGFFGIMGSKCYCEPYYEETIEGVGKEDTCDLACPGDDTAICGGTVKSSIFEMHICGDRGQQLVMQAQNAGRILSSFYATALFAASLGSDLQASGELLEEVGGLGGDPDSANYGRDAKKWAGELEKVFQAEHCLDEYNALLMAYEESETLAFSNLRKSENLQRADDLTQQIVAGIPKVKDCTKLTSKAVTKGYYPFADAVDSASDREMLKMEEKYGTATVVFSPLLLAVASKKEPMMSTCVGEPLGKPMVGTFAECAEACDQMIHPEVCLGFQFYHMGGKEDSGGSKAEMRPLCFLFKDIEKIVSYDCEFINVLTKEYKDDQKEAAESEKEEFLQKKESLLQRSIALRGRMRANSSEPEGEDEEADPKIAEAHCSSIKSFLLYTAMTCDELFGADSSVKETCPTECERTNGAVLAASCMVKLAEVSPAMGNPEITEKKRCFAGARNKEATNPEGIDPFPLPFDEQGVVLSGDAAVGTSTILEPIIWTVSEEEEGGDAE